MQLSPPRQIAVFGNIHQPSKGQYVEEILHQLMNHGFQIAIEQRFDHYITRELGINTTDIPKFNQATPVFDMAISVGGDGTFLNTAAHIKDLGIPILGINTGRLGFMADVSLSHIDQAIHALINSQYRIEERSVIHASTNGLGFKSYPYALNEVAILKHDNASLIEIEVTINGSVLTNYLADGIIVSTPTGSTGYSLSAGGPIMVPDSRNFCISAVAPHSLYIRPIVLCDNARISLSVCSRTHNFLVSIDGRSESFSTDTQITLQKAPYCVKIVKIFHQHFFNTLKEKMMWGIDNRI